MREIGSLASESAAKLFADHLKGMGIGTRLMARPDRVSIWVLDEDRLSQATAEFRQFEQNPDDPRFQAGARAARAVEEAVKRAEKAYRKNYVDRSGHWDRPIWKRSPITSGMLVISVLVAIATSLGKDEGTVFESLTFTQYLFNPLSGEVIDLGLEPIKSGQVWRLITPIFLHFSPMHLLFNAIWIAQLGKLIESRKGTWKFLLMVLLIAVASNLGQYLESVVRHRVSVFGGLSGVVYGLFGYAWIRGRVRPEEGIGIDARNVQLMMIWFVLCLTGLVGPIANSAHGVGLVVGILLALSPL